MAAKRQIFSLQNKVAIITGASSGIGRATATLFNQQNAKVIAIDINEEGLHSLQTELNNDIDIHKADVTDKNAVKSYMDNIFNKYGKINILCNSAGGVYDYQTEGLRPFHLRELDTITDTINMNLWGSIYNCYYVIGYMLQTITNDTDVNTCSIINISSIMGTAASSLTSDYTISKHGVDGLTQAICADYTASGIRCNAVKPGYINTPLVNKADAYLEETTGTKGVEKLVQNICPTERLGEAEDVANLCLYLASDESKFVSGSLMTIDSGTMATLSHAPSMIPHQKHY